MANSPATPVASACVEIGGFNGDLVRRVADELAGAPPGAWRVEQFERQEQARWWVHLPPQPSRESVERKLGELRRRNVTDVAVVSGGSPLTYTVSLGLFQERDHAEHFLDNLREHGVRTALLSDAPHPLTRQWLRVRNADAALRTRLDEVRRRYGVSERPDVALPLADLAALVDANRASDPAAHARTLVS